MQQILLEKLWDYIVSHNPELILGLQDEFSVTAYLTEKVRGVNPLIEAMLAEQKPQYIIEEACLQEMTAELRPSKFLYIREIVEEEFPVQFGALQESGTLTYEIINLIGECRPLFDELGFRENGENGSLRYAVMAQVDEYLK
ncbi:hypothetical protein [Flavobacterium lindanitolerans]|uniref:hypothetical protein n=1 Tax=Flavobacterium lindanitolerans TaxID=428988 RepID=UPI0023F12069|nr:hypothetical protein [Flavobacterium lindanitolerans]